MRVYQEFSKFFDRCIPFNVDCVRYDIIHRGRSRNFRGRVPSSKILLVYTCFSKKTYKISCLLFEELGSLGTLGVLRMVTRHQLADLCGCSGTRGTRTAVTPDTVQCSVD